MTQHTECRLWLQETQAADGSGCGWHWRSGGVLLVGFGRGLHGTSRSIPVRSTAALHRRHGTFVNVTLPAHAWSRNRWSSGEEEQQGEDGPR